MRVWDIKKRVLSLQLGLPKLIFAWIVVNCSQLQHGPYLRFPVLRRESLHSILSHRSVSQAKKKPLEGLDEKGSRVRLRKAIQVLFSVLLLQTIELLFSFIFNSKFNKKTNSKQAKLYWIYNIASCSHWAKQHLQAQQTGPQGRHWLRLWERALDKLASGQLAAWLWSSG